MRNLSYRCFWGYVDLGLSNLYSYLSIRLYALLWVGPGLGFRVALSIGGSA